MNTDVQIREGEINFQGHQTWYRIVGRNEQPAKLPLLCLHGGPGAPHDHLEPLEVMAATGRSVILCDQLGCGHSDQPHNPTLWTVELYVAEIQAIRQALGLERVHVLGQSWVGMLGMEYALTQPEGLESLIVADSPASMEQWLSEANRLREALPDEVQQTLLDHETAGTTSDPDFQEAMLEFFRCHVYRLDPWPDCVNRAFAKLEANRMASPVDCLIEWCF